MKEILLNLMYGFIMIALFAILGIALWFIATTSTGRWTIVIAVALLLIYKLGAEIRKETK